MPRMRFLYPALPFPRVHACWTFVLCGISWAALHAAVLHGASAPASIPRADPHHALRQSLETPAAAGADDETYLQNPTLPPGLRGEILEKQGAFQEALAVYRQQLGAGSTSPGAARLRLARLAAKTGEAQVAATTWKEILQDDVWAREVLVLGEALEHLHGLADASANIKALADAQGRFALARLPTPEDSLRREAYAKALALLLDAKPSPSETQRIFQRLYVDLAETVAAKEALSTRLSSFQDDIATHRLSRARVLSERHDNQAVLDTLQPVATEKGWKKTTRCEAKYLMGKAARKMRQYKNARGLLHDVVEKCPEPWRKNARYLLARVASFSGGKKSAQTLDEFLAAYPADRFTDDVLIWQAQNWVQEKSYQKAASAYERVLREHADGDMYHNAQFELAFLLARQGDNEGARKILATVVNDAQSQVFLRDQARYWHGRLLLHPEWGSWQENADDDKKREGMVLLSALAADRPASFYGNLAHQLVARAEPKFAATISAAAAAPVVSWQHNASSGDQLEISRALSGQPSFQHALAFLNDGFDPEAALLLDGVDRKSLTNADRLAMTAMYARARARDRSHRLLRESGYALPKGKPEPSSALLWSLAYPLAHSAAIAPAAEEFRLPPPLLYGLAREESAFEAEVVSWAGAIGLCQLMPFTAREEAERVRVALPSLEALRDPRLNARLGASHLARRMSLGHPLLAIAAYNAGPGNVTKWRKAHPDLPLDAFVESIPVEQTRNYVKKVTGSWVVYTWMTEADPAARVRYALDLPTLR